MSETRRTGPTAPASEVFFPVVVETPVAAPVVVGTPVEAAPVVVPWAVVVPAPVVPRGIHAGSPMLKSMQLPTRGENAVV
jgi:hypothetical protein